MPRSFRFLAWILLVPVLAGCQGGGDGKGGVNPEFGIRTLILRGTIRYEHDGKVEEGTAFMRREEPGKFELIATKDKEPWVHLLAEKEAWQIEFPGENLVKHGATVPGDERLALWIETHRMVIMAIKKAQFIEDYTQTVRGEYRNGRDFVIEMSEFKHVVGQILATKLRLTCKGCKSTVQIEIQELE